MAGSDLSPGYPDRAFSDGGKGLLPFLDRTLLLLSQGSYTTTYKYGLLLALIDLCSEGAGKGLPPTSLTTQQVAEKMLAIYWPHTKLFRGGVLDQSTNRHGGRQARSELGILGAIREVRERVAPADTSPFRAKQKDPLGYAALVRRVQWLMIKQAIPRLQIIGAQEDRFLYDIRWRIAATTSPVLIDDSRTIRQSDVGTDGFDDALRFLPGASEHLVQLAPLLRPLIKRQWTQMIERINLAPGDGLLEDHLFGQERARLVALQPALLSFQGGRCFYCDDLTAGRKVQVDHFLPWARYPDDSLGNLVVAHSNCNLSKSDFLADIPHAIAWAERDSSGLHEIAEEQNWPCVHDRSLSAALMVYQRLHPESRLWTPSGGMVQCGELAPLVSALQLGIGRESRRTAATFG
jgi:hypothetical protein